MNEYRITVVARYNETYYVNADSEEEAREKYDDGAADYSDQDFIDHEDGVDVEFIQAIVPKIKECFGL